MTMPKDAIAHFEVEGERATAKTLGELRRELAEYTWLFHCVNFAEAEPELIIRHKNTLIIYSVIVTAAEIFGVDEDVPVLAAVRRHLPARESA
jgi:hypothetical protein